MADDTRAFLALLDTQIAVVERDLEEAQRAVERIGRLSSDLHSLKRTREIVAAKGTDAPSSPASPDVSSAPTASNTESRPDFSPRVFVGYNSHDRAAAGSVAALLQDVLREADRPTHLHDLVTAICAKGRPVTAKTVSATISHAIQRGQVKREGPGIYALSRQSEATQ